MTLIDDNVVTIATTTSAADGSYSFDERIGCSSTYSLRVVKDDCENIETTITTPNKSETIIKDVLMDCTPPCNPCNLGECFNIDRIHFDFDMFNIRDDLSWTKRNDDGTYTQTSNAGELGILLGVLEAYPNLVISIESHTDSRGSHAYNEWLSKQRAIATRNWLISRGVAPERLCAMAFGETEPVNRCVDGVQCDEDEHDFNRRSEYRVLSGLEGCTSVPRKACITETKHTQWRRR